MAPIRIGIGKSNRRGGGGEGSLLKELPLGETNKPIKTAQGTGQNDCCSLNRVSYHSPGLSLAKKKAGYVQV